jgi:hypothetical protein
MEIRWFGEPWGNSYRAPICSSDDNKVDVPVGHECIECGFKFKESSQGIVTPCSPSIWGHWFLNGEPVCAYDLSCWLQEVVGGEMSHRILERMHKRPVKDDFTTFVPPEGPVVPGRGWGKGKDGEADRDD